MSTATPTTADTTATPTDADLADTYMQLYPRSRVTEYVRGVWAGQQCLSGADLRGQASRYGASYRDARCRAVTVAELCGAHVRRGAHGRLTLVWGDIPDDAKLGRCSVGDCWAY